MREHPTYAEPIGLAEPVQAGPDLGATDYRANPSARQHEHGGGEAVPPVADRRITTYDLPSELRTYDRAGQS